MIPYAVSIKYMLAGYLAIFIIFGIYLVSLVMRWRKMKRDLELLEGVQERLKDGDK